MTEPSESTALVVRDEEILRLRLAGRPTRLLAQQFGLTTDQINSILDHALELISDALRCRITALELERLDTLSEKFFEKAAAGDPVACGLAIKLSERRCALVGLDYRHQDPVQVALVTHPQPQSIDLIRAALDRISSNGGSPAELYDASPRE